MKKYYQHQSEDSFEEGLPNFTEEEFDEVHSEDHISESDDHMTESEDESEPVHKYSNPKPIQGKGPKFPKKPEKKEAKTLTEKSKITMNVAGDHSHI